MTEKQEDTTPQQARSDVREALERVLASDGFSSSPRLQEFLAYIVERELEGRGSSIKGKLIATDVYGKELDENGGALNLVRVEARRLRRGLDSYYSGEGQTDHLQISMRTGGYRPHFHQIVPAEVVIKGNQSEFPNGSAASNRKLVTLIGLAAIVSAFVLVVVILLRPATNDQTATANSSAELAALRAASLASVQAVNLAAQTRGSFFPLFDNRRQTINLNAFQHVIDLDPKLPAGYAGAAQVLALKAILASNANESASLLNEALERANQAVTISPTDAWSQAALGWALAVSGDTATGLSRARLAADLEPQDGHVLDLVGITALLANDPSFMAEVSHPNRTRVGDGRFAYNNIFGASQLMLENYEEVVDSFSTAAERGHPVSPPSLFLLATAYQEMGDSSKAKQLIEEMRKTWPGFPAREVATRFFTNDPVTRARVLSVFDTNTKQ